MTEKNNILYINEGLGGHLGFMWTIFPTITSATKLNMYSVQFFMGNPQKAWQRQQISQSDINNTKLLVNENPLNIFSHYPYCANLAGKSKQDGLAWSGNYSVDISLKKMLEVLEYELDIISNFKNIYNKCGVVIHPGSYPDRKKGHEAVANSINKINFSPDACLILENCAGEGNKLCKNIEELGYVLSLLHQKVKKYVKICIDTAHIWGNGDYDIRKIDEIDRLFIDIDNLVGLHNFYLLHLNDSKASFGSKKDLHESIGYGNIWTNNFTTLKHLLDKCQYYKIPIIIETHNSYECMLNISKNC